MSGTKSSALVDAAIRNEDFEGRALRDKEAVGDTGDTEDPAKCRRDRTGALLTKAMLYRGGVAGGQLATMTKTIEQLKNREQPLFFEKGGWKAVGGRLVARVSTIRYTI